MGGLSEPALRRCAARGDAFFGPNCSLQESLSHRERLQRLREEADRAAAPLDYYLRVQGDLSPENLARHEEAGLEHAVVSPWRAGHRAEAPGLEERLHDLERIAEAATPGGYLRGPT
jgi:hypothetical protein